MLRRNTLILFSFVFIIFGVGCGHIFLRNPEAKVERHVRAFERAARSAGYPMKVRYVSVKLVPMESDVEGVCRYNRSESGDFSNISISLNSTFWDSRSDSEQEMTVFHELGHCVLHRDHLASRNMDGRVKSIMSFYGVPRDDYEAYQTAYIDELFNGAY